MGEGKLPNQVVRERIAQLLRTESRRWGLKPEGIHPLKGAIQNGKMDFAGDFAIGVMSKSPPPVAHSWKKVRAMRSIAS